MKKAALILLILVNSNLCIHAQDLITKWSDKIELHNSKDGFFSYFLGENDDYLYAYFKKKGVGERKKIVAFDKKTMKRRFAAEVIGYPSNSKESKKFKKDSKRIQKDFKKISKGFRRITEGFQKELKGLQQDSEGFQKDCRRISKAFRRNSEGFRIQKDYKRI